MVHDITYDLRKPGQDYTPLYEAIKALGTSYKHDMQSTWLVASTDLTAGHL